MSRPTQAAAVDFAWSLWTELGVPGVARGHRQVAIDPEPLIVASPHIFVSDPRLRDQVYGWCMAHADRVSTSRIRGLLGEFPPPTRKAFASFSATLRDHVGIRWPTPGDAQPWDRSPDVDPPRLPVQRPALVRLRLRALSGVGARADVLAELLARTGTWITASDLAREGYSKRTIALILSELADAGIAQSHAHGNTLRFQLGRPDQLDDLVQAHDVAFPSWRLVFTLVLDAFTVAELAERPASVRRVEAHAIREKLAPLAQRLGLDMPPTTAGNPAAWDNLLAWTSAQVDALARGVSPILQSRT